MKDNRYLQFQATLEKNSIGLAYVKGYDRLQSSIRDVADWDGFQAISAQIKTTSWFKDKEILKEIEPPLPHREGYADILISFSQQDIYCEVSSLESPFKSIEATRQDINNAKIEIKLQKRPYLTKQDIEHEIKNDRIIRNLLIKTNKQLPINHPGILALETGRAMVYLLEVKKEIAKKLFNKRPQVMLIMLWSLERGSDIGEAPFWFVNPKSQYQNIGQELLKYLGASPSLIFTPFP